MSKSTDLAAGGHFPPGTAWRFVLLYIGLYLPFAVATPYLQKLLALRGFPEDHIGLVLGCCELMAVLAPPLWGILSDRSGRPRLVLCAAVCGMVPAFQLFGVVRSLPAALGVALLFGFLFRPLIPLTDGLTFRFIHQRGGDYGRIRIGGSLAFTGMLLLLEQLGIGASPGGRMILVAMAVAGTVQLTTFLLAPGLGHGETAAPAAPAPSQGTEAHGLHGLLRPAFLWFTLCAFLGRLAMMGYYGFFTLYLFRVHGVEKAGLIWLVGAMSEIPIIYYSRPIMQRIGVRNLFALGVLGVAVRLGGFSVAPGLWLVVPLQVLHALTFGAFHCSTVTYVSRVVPSRLQSTAQTVFAAVVTGGGGILGGALGGILARQYGFRVMYAAFGGLAAGALVLLLITVPTLAQLAGSSSCQARR